MEGKNGWLAPIQAMSTQQLTLFPYTTSPRSCTAPDLQHSFVSLALSMGEFDLKKIKKEKKAHIVGKWLVSCCEWRFGMERQFEFASKSTEYIKSQLQRGYFMVLVFFYFL